MKSYLRLFSCRVIVPVRRVSTKHLNYTREGIIIVIVICDKMGSAQTTQERASHDGSQVISIRQANMDTWGGELNITNYIDSPLRHI